MLKVIIVLTAIICTYAAPFNVSDEDATAEALGLVISRETRDTLQPSMLSI